MDINVISLLANLAIRVAIIVLILILISGGSFVASPLLIIVIGIFTILWLGVKK